MIASASWPEGTKCTIRKVNATQAAIPMAARKEARRMLRSGTGRRGISGTSPNLRASFEFLPCGEFPFLAGFVGGGFGFYEEVVEGAVAVEEEFEFGGVFDEFLQFGLLEGRGFAEDPCGDAGFEMLIGGEIEWWRIVGHGKKWLVPSEK